MSMATGLNRISVVIPANSANAAIERDAAITNLIAMGITNWQKYHYTDTSPLGIWKYFALGTLLSANGIVTVATVTCAGVTHPANGSNITANPDPGVGSTYVWSVLGAPFGVSTSGDGGGGSIPQGNNNYYVWNIPGNSTAPVTDFTTAVTTIAAALAGTIVTGTVVIRYLKYVDSVSGAWQVSALFFGAGSTEAGATSPAVLASSNIMYAVTCSGTPNPPSGSSFAAVSLPAFTQTPMVTITAPLSFGPMR